MTNYLKLTFENVEPLKIADDSSSQSGQTNTLTYVPGTVLRGAIIQELVQSNQFEDKKQELLSNSVSFLNAYPSVDGKELMPSPKGFYENKVESGNQEKTIENMLIDGNITPGNKRAGLGKYAYLEDGCIHYTNVKLGSDMKMNKGKHGDKQNVFRNQFIKPGYQFVGYIAVRENSGELINAVEALLKSRESLTMGGNRSYGYGKCILTEVEKTTSIPYAGQPTAMSDKAYMILLSNLSMVNAYGENTGIDVDLLQKKLELNHLAISLCSTSVVDVRGYNRTWQTFLPSSKMYEMGSVFKLDFAGEKLSEAALTAVMNDGIGVRTNEGYGRVLFLSTEEYEAINKKKEISAETSGGRTGNRSDALSESGSEAAANEKPKPALTQSEEQTLKIAAEGYYRMLIERAVNRYVAKDKNSITKYRLTNSQLGTISSIIMANMYNEKEAFDKLEKYFENAMKKDNKNKVQGQNRQSRSEIAKYIRKLKDASLPELFEGLPAQVMGMEKILEEDEIIRIKLDLVIRQIKYANRGGIGNE